MSQLGQYLSQNAISSPIDTLTGNVGGAVPPDVGGNLNIIGAGDITVTGNAGTNTLTITTSGAVADSFVSDAGTATPLLGVLNVIGGTNIGTTGAANNLTINLDGTTNHAVQVGTGALGLTSLTVGTNGQVLLGSTAANPVFGTLTSSDSSIAFTTGAGTLSLQVAGGTTVGKTITGDSGGALAPTAGNWNIVGGLNTVTSGAVSTLTVAASPAQYLTNYSVANVATYVATATDYYITVDTSTIPVTIQLPNAPTIYRRFIIKDSAGNAAAQNVTVTTVAGIKLLDGAATFVMNTNYQAIELVYDNFGYQIF